MAGFGIELWQDSPTIRICSVLTITKSNDPTQYNEQNNQTTMPAFLQTIGNTTILSPYGTSIDGKHNLWDETVLNGRGTNVDGAIDVVHHSQQH